MRAPTLKKRWRINGPCCGLNSASVRAIAAALAAAIAPAPALSQPDVRQIDANALPVPDINAGFPASFSQQDSESGPWRVTNPNGGSLGSTVLNWTSFDVGSDINIDFDLTSPATIVLNRINSSGAGLESVIAGGITSIGQLWFVNPSGIVISSTGRIDASGILLTTSPISDGEFTEFDGAYSFGNSPGGTVVNHGRLRAFGTQRGGDGAPITQTRGYVILAAPGVRNTGVIGGRLSGGDLVSAFYNDAVLAGARAFAVTFDADGLIGFTVDAAALGLPAGFSALVEQSASGTTSAFGGGILVTAEAADAIVDNVINLDGLVQATSIRRDDSGGINADGAFELVGPPARPFRPDGVATIDVAANEGVAGVPAPTDGDVEIGGRLLAFTVDNGGNASLNVTAAGDIRFRGGLVAFAENSFTPTNVEDLDGAPLVGFRIDAGRDVFVGAGATLTARVFGNGTARLDMDAGRDINIGAFADVFALTQTRLGSTPNLRRNSLAETLLAAVGGSITIADGTDGEDDPNGATVFSSAPLGAVLTRLEAGGDIELGAWNSVYAETAAPVSDTSVRLEFDADDAIRVGYRSRIFSFGDLTMTAGSFSVVEPLAPSPVRIGLDIGGTRIISGQPTPADTDGPDSLVVHDAGGPILAAGGALRIDVENALATGNMLGYAGGDLRLTGGTVAIGDSLLSAGGALSIDATGSDAGDLLAVGDASLSSDSDLTITGRSAVTLAQDASLFATGDLSLDATGLLTIGDAFLSSDSDLTITGRSAVTLEPGAVLSATEILSLDATGLLTIGDASLFSDSDLTITGRSAVTLEPGAVLSATGVLSLDATGLLTIGDAFLSSDSDLAVTGLNTISIGQDAFLSAGNDLTLKADNDLSIGDGAFLSGQGVVAVSSGPFLTVNAGAFIAGSQVRLASDGTISIFGAQNGVLFAGPDASAADQTALSGGLVRIEAPTLVLTTDSLSVEQAPEFDVADLAWIRNATPGRAIRLNGDGDGALLVDQSFLALFDSSVLRIGRNDTEAPSGDISLFNAISRGPGLTFSLVSGGDIVSAAGATVDVSALALLADDGDDASAEQIALTGANRIGEAAAASSGDIALTNAQSLAIGAADGLSGATSRLGGDLDIRNAVSSARDASLVAAGDLSVGGGVATPGALTLAAGGDIVSTAPIGSASTPVGALFFGRSGGPAPRNVRLDADVHADEAAIRVLETFIAGSPAAGGPKFVIGEDLTVLEAPSGSRIELFGSIRGDAGPTAAVRAKGLAQASRTHLFNTCVIGVGCSDPSPRTDVVVIETVLAEAARSTADQSGEVFRANIEIDADFGALGFVDYDFETPLSNSGNEEIW